MEIVEIVPYLASFITALLGGLFSIWVAKKIMFSSDNIIEMADVVLEYALKTDEGQKRIYLLGALLGNGIKQGIGITGKTGKFKLEDILVQAGAHLLSKAFGGSEGQPSQQESSKLPWEA